MLDLDDIRRIFDEEEIIYDDQEEFLAARYYSDGDERVPCLVFASIQNTFLRLEITTTETIRINLNEKYLALLNRLNNSYFCFKFVLAESDEDYRLILRYDLDTDFVTGPEVILSLIGGGLHVYDEAFHDLQCIRYQ